MIQRTIHIPDDDAAYIVECPDGFYWVDPDSDVELGPFRTAALARANMESIDSGYESGCPAEDVDPRIKD